VKPLASLLALALALAAAPAAQESCGVCHGEHGESEALGAHAAAGVGCVACHGGRAGPLDVAGAHEGGVHVARGPRASVELCGGCHADPLRMRGSGLRTDQLLLYAGSGHGRRLAEEDDPDVATCVSCHGAHGVLAHTDPRSPVHPRRQPETCARCHADAEKMRRYELPADPPALYRDSVHGRALLERGALGSPACATCHGSHGATPPGVDEVGRTCGRCHAPAREHFERSPHLAPAREGVIEECVSCHGSHAVAEATEALLIGSEAGHCGSCHRDGPELAAVGAGLHARLSEFDAALRAAEGALARAAAGGIFVERESDMLGQARAVRAQASPLVHALSREALDERLELGRGMVAETLEGLEHKQRELGDRQVLVLVFFGVVLLLAGVLLVHAREVAGRATGSPGALEPGPGAERGRG
jgi:hypothetical protein